MKVDYNLVLKISIVLASLAFAVMTFGFFILIVYVREGWPWGIYFIISGLLYIPGISGIVWGNQLKTKARVEALRID
ncbi:MAG: hypothetical protein R6W96_03125 [Clostridia bacterium]